MLVKLLSVCFLWGLYLLWKRREYYKLMFQIPGPLGLPIIGMAYQLRNGEEILQVFERYQKKHGPLIFSWLGPMPFLVVSEPQYVKDILTSPHCVNKSVTYDAVNDGVGCGLFNLKNPEWSKHRRILNPAFGRKVLVSFIPIFNEEVDSLLLSFDMLIGKGPVDFTDTLQEFTFKTALRTTMGCLSGQENLKYSGNVENSHLVESYARVLEMLTQMCFAPWLKFKTLRLLLRKSVLYEDAKRRIRLFVSNLVQNKIKLILENNGIQDDDEIADGNVFINLAIDLFNRGSLTFEDVVNESNVVIFGAFETTAKTISYTLLLLAMHPQYQEKAYEEIVSVFPNDKTFEVSYSHLQQMVYMDMLISEAMRLLAPVPIIARETTDDIRLSNDVIVPKGVQIAVDIFHMHRRSDIWGPKAQEYDPDHFLPINLESKHPYAFIPFTKGIRNCIGWRYALISVKISLIKLLKNYRFTTNGRLTDLQFVEDITLKFKNMPLLEVSLRTESEC